MSEPIRVLHILQRMEAGGTQALLMNIYRKIDRTKVQFDFLVEYPDKQFYDDEIRELGGKIYYSTVRKDLNIIKFIKYLNRILLEHPEYRIVHVHTYSIGYFCLKTAKKVGVPVRIAHSHSNAMTVDYKRYIKNIMQKLYTVYATDLMACSKEAGQYLFHDRKFKVLPNAIDAAKFTADSDTRIEIRKKLKIEDSFVVGHTGRFRPEKNHKFLIDVFVEIKKRISNSKLLLIGNGDPSDEIQEYIKENNIYDDVIILTNRRDMYRLYQSMDLFVFPSKYEGLGIVSIEAQAAGIPVLCSDRVPVDTKITPLYVSMPLDKSPEEWATCGIQLANNSMAHSNTFQNIVDAGFDINEVAQKMEKFYLVKARG